MSSEAPQLDATTATIPQTEQSIPQQQQQQQQQPIQDDAASTNEKDAAAATAEEATPSTKSKKPNPLKKVKNVFKTLFSCFRKPAVGEDGAVAPGTAGGDASAGAAGGAAAGEDGADAETKSDVVEITGPVTAEKAPVVGEELTGGEGQPLEPKIGGN